MNDMKSLNSFSIFRSSRPNLQSSDVSHDCRLTVGSPSGLNAKWMLKLVSVLVLILTLGSGNAWGTDLTFESFSRLGSSSYPSGSTTSSPITLASSGWYGASATELRIKSGATVTISCTSRYKITNIVFTATETKYTKLQSPVKWSGTTGTYTNASGTASVTFSNSAQCRFSKIVVTYTADCIGLEMSTVTAAPGNGSISLSWPAVANADSYTVTCKEKSSGDAAGTASAVTGTTTKSCTITGLINGTEYTWSVMPVGSGDDCDSNTPATGDATPNFLQTHTVDWYVGGSAPANKIGDDGQTTVVDHGGKISAFPATTPDGSACDKTFVGWTNTSSYVHGTSPLFNDVADSPTINADASFYAVFASQSSQTATFDAATISGLTKSSSSLTWTHNTSGIALYLSSGQRYTNGTPNTFTVTNGTSNYCQLSAPTGIKMSKVIATLSGTGYKINTVSTPWTLSTSSTTQTISSTNGSDYLKMSATSSKQIRITELVVTYASYSDYTIICGSCSNEVTVAYTAAPTGGTVSVTKSATPVTSGSTVKTCTSTDLSVTITPAPHYTLTGFTATGLTTGTATISPVVAETLPKTTETTFTVTVSAGATGTLNLTPTFTEDAHVAINWNVNGVNQSIAATEGLTWVYSGGDITALPSTPSVPAGCSGTKVFAGWSTKHSDATEEDALYYDDLFTAVGDAPTGISSEKTFYAVFATSSSNPLAGTVLWDEPFDGNAGDQPSSPTSGATVYGSASIAYNCASTTYCKLYTDNPASGGAAAPELLVPKSSRSEAFEVNGIPSAGQTELTLTYMAKDALTVTTGTSGVTVGDVSVEGNLYTRTITIDQSGLGIATFGLTFAKSTDSNSRLDDIHLVVPGSGTMTDYVTLCAPSWTITYDKNTSDPVTNLPSPTSVLQSTGSGTLSATKPTRATYTFGGWATTADGAKVYDAGDAITGVTADKTLYAVWTKTPIEEINLNYHILNKYVGDDAVTLAVTSVVPDGADMSVTWSSSNPSVASVEAATGVVSFSYAGTATITATSTVTGTTTAVCNVTVRNKPTATFVDLIHNGNGTDLSTYNLQNVAGTLIVFPTLSNTEPGAETCEDQHYIFVGWTTSDNNDDPQDHLVTSDALENDVNKTFYAVWADGKEGYSYTQLTSNSFEPAPTKYVIGVKSSGTMYYFNSCANTGSNNSWGYTTNDPTNNPPIQFTLSGTASELIATSTEAPARYIVPLTTADFKMSTSSQTLTLNEDGTIHNTGTNNAYALRGNSANLRWYSKGTGNPVYFYKVEAGSAVSYRTSCCADPLAAPSVTATNTAYTVTLTWDAVAGATGYEVSWNNGAWTAATSPVNKTSLTASTTYTYKVRATYNEAVHCGARVASGNVTTDDVYSVTYSGGTGTGSCSPTGSVATVTYEAGETVTLAATDSYNLTSNNFAAWGVKDAENNDVAVSNNQFTMPASNVTVTATWTAVQDKYYDRMHQSTDASHGGIADGNGKYYIVREGCNYTVPSPADDKTGDTDCHTTHFKLLGWIAQSHLKSDGSIKDGEESYLFQGGTIKSATGATYYAIYAIMTE